MAGLVDAIEVIDFDDPSHSSKYPDFLEALKISDKDLCVHKGKKSHSLLEILNDNFDDKYHSDKKIYYISDVDDDDKRIIKAFAFLKIQPRIRIMNKSYEGLSIELELRCSAQKGLGLILLEHVYDYERLVLSKDDLNKRKRIKNSIPINNRCNAKRANGEQCTRRRKDDCEFCGTHVKGTPHGYIQLNSKGEELSEKKIEVVAEEVLGIVYYIDNLNNVYKTEDILEGKTNPEVIAKCVRNNNTVSIPELGLI